MLLYVNKLTISLQTNVDNVDTFNQHSILPFCYSSSFFHPVNAFTPVVYFIIICYILETFITWVLLYGNVRTAFVSIVLRFQSLTFLQPQSDLLVFQWWQFNFYFIYITLVNYATLVSSLIRDVRQTTDMRYLVQLTLLNSLVLF